MTQSNETDKDLEEAAFRHLENVTDLYSQTGDELTLNLSPIFIAGAAYGEAKAEKIYKMCPSCGTEFDLEQFNRCHDIVKREIEAKAWQNAMDYLNEFTGRIGDSYYTNQIPKEFAGKLLEEARRRGIL